MTVIKDAAGRYFASFVVETLPETTGTVGVDLGLTHFAVLFDGRKIDSPVTTTCLRHELPWTPGLFRRRGHRWRRWRRWRQRPGNVRVSCGAGRCGTTFPRELARGTFGVCPACHTGRTDRPAPPDRPANRSELAAMLGELLRRV